MRGAIDPTWEALPIDQRRLIYQTAANVLRLDARESTRAFLATFVSAYRLSEAVGMLLLAEARRPGTAYIGFMTDHALLDDPTASAGQIVICHGLSHEEASGEMLRIYRQRATMGVPWLCPDLAIHAFVFKAEDYLFGDYDDPDSLYVVEIERSSA